MLLRHFVNPLPNAAQVKLSRVNHCIYCGSTERLSDEHIIPNSIGGEIILPKSSCPCGRELTHAFEGDAAREMFNHARRQAGVRGNRKRRKYRPTTLAVNFINGSRLEMPFNEHPSVLIFPRMHPPQKVGGFVHLALHPKTNDPVLFDFWGLSADWFARAKRASEKARAGFTFDQSVFPFIRLLAKIGHAAATAVVGFGGFQHELLPIIRDETDEYATNIGESPVTLVRILPFDYPCGLHQIGVARLSLGGRPYIAAQIRLFSNLFREQLYHLTPSYLVIAGKERR